MHNVDRLTIGKNLGGINQTKTAPIGPGVNSDVAYIKLAVQDAGGKSHQPAGGFHRNDLNFRDNKRGLRHDARLAAIDWG